MEDRHLQEAPNLLLVIVVKLRPEFRKVQSGDTLARHPKERVILLENLPSMGDKKGLPVFQPSFVISWDLTIRKK
jgi:hypothetical protein